MTTIDRKPADLKLVEPTRDKHQGESLPSAEGEISALASAGAPFIFFDGVPFCSINTGLGGITLSAARQIRSAPDRGVVSDHAIVAHLRGSLKSLMDLRDTLNNLEQMAKEQLEAAAEAASANIHAPPHRPH